jgi:hypothetical protein
MASRPLTQGGFHQWERKKSAWTAAYASPWTPRRAPAAGGMNTASRPARSLPPRSRNRQKGPRRRQSLGFSLVCPERGVLYWPRLESVIPAVCGTPGQETLQEQERWLSVE